VREKEGERKRERKITYDQAESSTAGNDEEHQHKSTLSQSNKEINIFTESTITQLFFVINHFIFYQVVTLIIKIRYGSIYDSG